MTEKHHGTIIIRADGKEHRVKGSISYNLGERAVEDVRSEQIPSMPIQGSIQGTITNPEALDAFVDEMRKKHEAEIQETLAQIRKEMQDEIQAFMSSRGKKGKPLTMRQMRKARNVRKLKALMMRKMLELHQRGMIAMPWGDQ